MLRLMAEKDELKVVSDQIGCPTNANSLAKYLWQLAEQETVEPIYHYSDLGVASWYDFAVAIQGIAIEQGKLEKRIPILPIPSSDYPTPALRPVFSLMKPFSNLNKEHWRTPLTRTIGSLIE